MSLEIRCVKDIQKAEIIWNLLTPAKSLYDTWEFRVLCYNVFPYEISFYTAYENGVPVALLPLQYNHEKKYLEFFGGGLMENNQIFHKPGYEKVIAQLYEAIHQKAKLEYIIGEDDFTKKLPFLENKYILDLKQFKNFENYFETSFKRKRKLDFTKRVEGIKLQGVQVQMNDFSDIDRLIDLNIKNFERRGEISSFSFPFRKEIYKSFPSLKTIEIFVDTFIINNLKSGVSLSFQYRDYFMFLNAGADNQSVPNLGTYIYFYLIKKAFDSGASVFDAGSGSFNWKELLHLMPIPQYIFEKD